MKQSLANYLADYVRAEIRRGYEITTTVIEQGIDAFESTQEADVNVSFGKDQKMLKFTIVGQDEPVKQQDKEVEVLLKKSGSGITLIIRPRGKQGTSGYNIITINTDGTLTRHSFISKDTGLCLESARRIKLR